MTPSAEAGAAAEAVGAEAAVAVEAVVVAAATAEEVVEAAAATAPVRAALLPLARRLRGPVDQSAAAPNDPGHPRALVQPAALAWEISPGSAAAGPRLARGHQLATNPAREIDPVSAGNLAWVIAQASALNPASEIVPASAGSQELATGQESVTNPASGIVPDTPAARPLFPGLATASQAP